MLKAQLRINSSTSFANNIYIGNKYCETNSLLEILHIEGNNSQHFCLIVGFSSEEKVWNILIIFVFKAL